MRLVSESVCVQVFRRAPGGVEYLMLRRAPKRGGFWQSVSGRVRRGERAEEAVRREVEEETGLTPLAVILLEKVNAFFVASDEAIHFEPCFGVEVGEGEPVLSREHDAGRWTDFAGAMQLTPFAGVRDALAELRDRLAGRGRFSRSTEELAKESAEGRGNERASPQTPGRPEDR